MKAEIISIGTELLMGELTETNAAWIAGKLPALGIQLQWVSIVGDDLDMLAEAFSSGLQRSDIIFTTGGLGPTQDDLTREGVAAFPDAVTARGTKHLRELANEVRRGNRAVMLFVVQRGDCHRFAPADDIDPLYGKTLREAAAAGVEMLAYRARVSPRELRMERPLPVVLP